MLRLIFVLENIIFYLGFFKNTSSTELHFSEANCRSARQEVYPVCGIQRFFFCRFHKGQIFHLEQF